MCVFIPIIFIILADWGCLWWMCVFVCAGMCIHTSWLNNAIVYCTSKGNCWSLGCISSLIWTMSTKWKQNVLNTFFFYYSTVDLNRTVSQQKRFFFKYNFNPFTWPLSFPILFVIAHHTKYLQIVVLIQEKTYIIEKLGSSCRGSNTGSVDIVQLSTHSGQ